MLLIFVLCLTLAGAGMIFLNTYLISGLKNSMRDKAILLAREQGHSVAKRILDFLKVEDMADLRGLRENPYLNNEFEIVLKGPNNILAVCVYDADGEVIQMKYGEDPNLIETIQDETSTLVEIQDPRGFSKIQVLMRKKMPDVKTREFKFAIEKDDTPLGHLGFLVSESSIYREIESTADEISRRLWSVVFAFVGVLFLGLYLMARLSRRQMHLLGENEQLGRMAYVGTLASGLAHEIRNPLNAMAVNLTVAREELVEDDKDSPELVQRALKLIQGEVERLNHSVTSFLAFARPEANREQITELRPLVDEILELLHPQIEETGTEVRVDLPEEAQLQADFSGLRQVLYNVVLNALQAMASPENDGRPRSLRIGGRRESAQWFLWIEDTGPGIPAGREETIFEAFHTTKAAGSGFGLSIARAIIDSHEGDITARRVTEGGVRIEITLPETSSKR